MTKTTLSGHRNTGYFHRISVCTLYGTPKGLIKFKPMPPVHHLVRLLHLKKFYAKILSTEASFYIYDRPPTDINAIASVCALNLRIILMFTVLKRWLLQQDNSIHQTSSRYSPGESRRVYALLASPLSTTAYGQT